MNRAEKCYELMHNDFRKLELRNQIHQKTNRELDKSQREYFLNQQMRAIQEELGGGFQNPILKNFCKRQKNIMERRSRKPFPKRNQPTSATKSKFTRL
ncbi:hypothetical protein LDL59_01435 [Kaistella anthropi]|nr:hypothetical protein [Kaistella anthropi]